MISFNFQLCAGISTKNSQLMTFHCYFLRRGCRVGSHDVFLFSSFPLSLRKINGVMAKDSYKIENEAFLAEVAKNPEVKALPKGIFYKVLATGDGKSAQTAAVVSVYYRGSLIDGKVFDDNTKQGYADAFRLRELITGWQIAIPKMHEGDKWEIYIPSELGYGKRGCPPDIPGNSTLIFEIELVRVN